MEPPLLPILPLVDLTHVTQLGVFSLTTSSVDSSHRLWLRSTPAQLQCSLCARQNLRENGWPTGGMEALLGGSTAFPHLSTITTSAILPISKSCKTCSTFQATAPTSLEHHWEWKIISLIPKLLNIILLCSSLFYILMHPRNAKLSNLGSIVKPSLQRRTAFLHVEYC